MTRSYKLQICIYTQTKTDKAYGGIYRNKWFQGKFPTKLLQGDETISMALLELYPIVVACVLWGKDWSGQRVLFNCDNTATVQIINKGRSKVNIIMKLMRKLTWCSAISNFTIHAKHVPGCFNSTADAISRFQMNKFRKLAPNADLHPVSSPPLEQLLMY